MVNARANSREASAKRNTRSISSLCLRELEPARLFSIRVVKSGPVIVSLFLWDVALCGRCWTNLATQAIVLLFLAPALALVIPSPYRQHQLDYAKPAMHLNRPKACGVASRKTLDFRPTDGQVGTGNIVPAIQFGFDRCRSHFGQFDFARHVAKEPHPLLFGI